MSSATLSSRHYLHLLAPGPAGFEGRFVREIMLLLDGISVGGTKHKRKKGFTSVMSVAKLSSLCKCLASTKFGSKVAMCLPARVVAGSSTPTTVSTDTISLCLANLNTGRVFATPPCGARTTIKEIILNLNVLGEEERKRLVLASSRKKADNLYPLKRKYIVLAFNKFVCVMSIFYVVSQDF